MNLYLASMATAVFLLIYPYMVYPLVVRVLAKRDADGHVRETLAWQRVSVVVSFHKAHQAVQKKVENLLQLDYPSDRWEAVFVSDGDNQETVRYLNALNLPQIKVLELGERVGKSEAENRARSVVSGEIIVFTDCSTYLHRSVLKKLLARFADPKVGAVSTVDRICGADGSVVHDGENAYVKQEMRVRNWETAAGMMIGLSGSCFACRREIYQIIAPETTRDLAAALISLKKGYVNLSADDAVCTVGTQSDIRKEFRRKVRTINNGVATLLHHRELLNPFRYPRISFALLSHKVLRWLSFPFLMVILVGSALGLNGAVRMAVLGGQLLLYLLAILFFFSGRSISLCLLRLGVKFVIACFAAFVAVIEAALGKRYVTWMPTGR